MDMFTLGVVATKGGVGKTTIAANLAGLLADMGKRVLLVDADIQPALSHYFDVSEEASDGLTRMVVDGVLTPASISIVSLPPRSDENSRHPAPSGAVHIVRSDAREREGRNGTKLQDWLGNRLDSVVRMRMALRNAVLEQGYDFAIIDTQGAVGHLQDAAVAASDLLVTPVSPDTISAREFIDGTLSMLERNEATANLGIQVPSMSAVINRTQRTTDSWATATILREQSLTLRNRFTLLHTTIASAVAYRKAATAQIPVHWIDPVKAGDALHALAWELLPQLQGQFAPNHRGKLDPAFDPSHPDSGEPDTGPMMASPESDTTDHE